MRNLIVATGILFIAASASAQSSTDGTADAPALTKTVIIQPGDSPLVAAAKRAVASRQHPSKRRVIVAGRGRYSQATGPTEGPSLPASAPATPTPRPQQQQQAWEQRNAAETRKVEAEWKLKQLDQEQQALAAEMDEPYGGDIEEDQVDQRMAQIQAEQQKLQAPPPPPPPHE